VPGKRTQVRGFNFEKVSGDFLPVVLDFVSEVGSHVESVY